MAVSGFAPSEFNMLTSDKGFQALKRYATILERNLCKCRVEYLDSAAGNDSCCEFRPFWQGEFSNQEDVYRVMKYLGNFTRDGNASAGKR